MVQKVEIQIRKHTDNDLLDSKVHQRFQSVSKIPEIEDKLVASKKLQAN
jgi:hypothetical protein